MTTWKTYAHYFEGLETHLQRIDAKKARLEALRPIPAIALKSIKESLTYEWTYNSNSIEGNTITLQETQLIIEEGITVKGKSLREHFETLNHHDAIEFVERLADTTIALAARTVLDVHALVLQRIEKEYAGRYRTSGVRITNANFTPPNALKVDEFMEELLAWVNAEGLSLHPIVGATVFHHRFVWIHPFFDGNGRTVRLLFNLLLMRDGYPPAIILSNDRKKYYDALNKANLGDYSKLLLLVLQAEERSLDIYLSNLESTYEDYQPIADIVNEPGFAYGQEYVSLLARQGKIDAFKDGRNWVTTKKAVADYVQTRKRKRTPKGER
jgi:Fic family protein